MTDLAEPPVAATEAAADAAPSPAAGPHRRHRRADPPHLITTLVCGLLALGAVLPGAAQARPWERPVPSAAWTTMAAPHSPPAVATIVRAPIDDARAETGDGARAPAADDVDPSAAVTDPEPASAAGGAGDAGVAAVAAPATDTEPVPAYLGGVPEGVGVWTWEVHETEGGDAAAIVAKAVEVGLSHLYARTGSSWMGLHGTAFLDDLLPVAHAAGIRVYGWDFPNFVDVADDVARAVAAIGHRAPGGHRIDGFVADIETRSEGTRLTAENALTYAEALRAAVGDDEVLVACVPNPTRHHQAIFPYDLVLPSFDAVAPMVYWLNREPDDDAAKAMTFFEPYGLPIVPVGQAYDGGPEGGRHGSPPPHELKRFAYTATDLGARGFSFWSWQHAVPETWETIRGLAAR